MNEVLTFEEFKEEFLNGVPLKEMYMKYLQSLSDANHVKTGSEGRISDITTLQTPNYQASQPPVSEEDANKILEALKKRTEAEVFAIQTGRIAIKLALMFVKAAA